MTYISSLEEESDAYKIFNWPWLCIIPEIFMRGTAVVAEEGTITTGDEEQDKEVQRSGRVQYKTIAAMVCYFEEGASIRFVNNDDILSIYKIVDNHLRNWEWIVTHHPFCTHPAIEDFYILEEFLIQMKPLKEAKETTLAPMQTQQVSTLFGSHGALLRASLLPRKLMEERQSGKVNIAMVNSVAERIARIVMKDYG